MGKNGDRKFRLVGRLPASINVGNFSYLVRLDNVGVRAAFYLEAAGIDCWVLASLLPGDMSAALETLRSGFSPPSSGRASEICESLAREGILERIKEG